MSLFIQNALAESREEKVLKTKYCTVLYPLKMELKTMSRKISDGFIYDIEYKRVSKTLPPEIRLSSKLDMLFERVEEILDMYPMGIHVKVKVYSFRREVMRVYEDIFKKRENVRAFYVYKYNTIYTSLQDISESVLAHEMAHCVIDHYFVILPPRKVQEILAMYVDVHLRE